MWVHVKLDALKSYWIRSGNRFSRRRKFNSPQVYWNTARIRLFGCHWVQTFKCCGIRSWHLSVAWRVTWSLCVSPAAYHWVKRHKARNRIRSTFFSNGVVKAWNELPQEATLDQFKGCLDLAWPSVFPSIAQNRFPCPSYLFLPNSSRSSLLYPYLSLTHY